jgi:hypothetical protein
MQAINKGLEKVEQELAASENEGAISKRVYISSFSTCWIAEIKSVYIQCFRVKSFNAKRQIACLQIAHSLDFWYFAFSSYYAIIMPLNLVDLSSTGEI